MKVLVIPDIHLKPNAWYYEEVIKILDDSFGSIPPVIECWFLYWKIFVKNDSDLQ